jgi:tungstate transport system substrate-binding protein
MWSKVWSIFLIVVIIGALFAVLPGCAAETTPASTPSLTPTPTSLPLLSGKPRFKVATTTSLYDTGLWGYLEPMFEQKYNVELDIVYAGTGAALNQGRNGNVDAVVVHDPDQEKTFVDEGFGIDKRAFAYNFFMIAGPASDPAGIKGMNPADAFKKIYEAGMADPDNVKFVSRGDNSGTHGAEKRLWASAGYDYTTGIEGKPWYVESGQGMGPTLIMSDQLNAYVLCDGSTFTFTKSKIALVSLVQNPAEDTLNIYDVYAINPEKIKTAKLDMAKNFINWLISPEIQSLIGEYGTVEFGGSLFNPITDGGCTYGPCPDPVENLKPVE